jgi:hypothetical protein
MNRLTHDRAHVSDLTPLVFNSRGAGNFSVLTFFLNIFNLGDESANKTAAKRDILVA